MFKKLSLLVMACALLSPVGCVSREPFFVSGNATQIELRAKDIMLQEPTQGTSSVTVVFGIPFGTPSYMEAETAALNRQNSDVLIDRVRYSGTEGVYFPVIGLVFGSQTYYVQGIGARFTR